jgi:hypothetical protein
MTLILLVSALAACDDAGDSLAGPGNSTGGSDVSLSIAVATAGAASMSTSRGALFDIVQNDGASELVIQRVAMVLREIELERQFDDDCDDHISGEDDDCEEFSTGPMILELPMDGSVDHVVTLGNVPADTYDEIEFEIHKPEDDTAEDREFIRNNPDFERVSIRVEGTFDGETFVYVTDLNEDQEYALVPPLEVAENTGPVNLTLSINVTTWFVTSGGSLIDPTSANKGGPNESLVEDNIERSIEIFEDHDRDGHHDSDDHSDDN